MQFATNDLHSEVAFFSNQKTVDCTELDFSLLSSDFSFRSSPVFSGAYSCLRVVLTFARQLSFFIVTIYIPCFMIVIVSWMSFWIDHKAVSWLSDQRKERSCREPSSPALVMQQQQSRFTHPSCFAFVQRFPLACPWASPPCLPCPPLKHPSTAPCHPWHTQRPLTCGVVSVSLLSSEPCSNMHSLIMPRGKCARH